MRICLLLFAVVLAMRGSTGAQTNAPDRFVTMTYQDFISLEAEARHDVFVQMSAAKQSTIVRDHLKTWKAERRAILNANQLRFLNEAIALASPEFYAQAGSAEIAEMSKRRLDEARRYFTEDDITEVFLLKGPAKRR